MTRGPVSFKGSDVTRAIKAVQAAGQIVLEVLIEPRTGTIKVLVGEIESAPAAPNTAESNEWDDAT